MRFIGLVHNDGVQEAVNVGFLMVAWGFILDSLQKIIVWLIVMFSVIICDLIAGCRRSLMMNEEVRFSSALRRTMGKTVTYFSFVIMVVMISQAVGDNCHIDKWAILFVCFIEGSSIISNILRPKGYDINMVQILSILTKKIFNIESEETKKIITKIKKEDNENK